MYIANQKYTVYKDDHYVGIVCANSKASAIEEAMKRFGGTPSQFLLVAHEPSIRNKLMDDFHAT